MKTARLCLLLLLAVLLPVRGAVAAAMLCMPAVPATAQAGVEHMQADSPHAHCDEAAPVQKACKHCAAFCGLTPLPSQPPALQAPQAFTRVAFPALAAPAAQFVRDGPERPPRSA